MPDLAQLTLQIVSDQVDAANKRLTELEQRAKAAEDRAKSLEQTTKKGNDTFSAQTGQVGGLIKMLMELAAAYSAVEAIRTAISTAAAEDRIEKGFANIMHSAEGALDVMNQIKAYAEGSQFSFEGLADGVRQFMALGMSAKDAVTTVKAVGDGLEALGSGETEIRTITSSMQRMLETGQANMYVFRSLATQGVPAVQMLAQALGKDLNTTMQLLRQGAISGSDAVKVLTAGLQQTAAQATVTQASYTQLWGQLKNTITIGLGDIAKKFMDTAGVKEMVAGLTNMLKTLESAAINFLNSSDAASKLQTAIEGVVTVMGILIGLQVIKWAVDTANNLFLMVGQLSNMTVGGQAAILAIGVLIGLEVGRWASEQFPALAKFAALLKQIATGISSITNFTGEGLADWWMGNDTAGSAAQNAAERRAHMDMTNDQGWKDFNATIDKINAGNLGPGQGKTLFAFAADDLKNLVAQAKAALPSLGALNFLEVPNSPQGVQMPHIQPQLSAQLSEQLTKTIEKTREEGDLLFVNNEQRKAETALMQMKLVLQQHGIDLDRQDAQMYLSAYKAELQRLQNLEQLKSIADGIGSAFANAFGQFIDGSKSARQAAMDFAKALDQLILKKLALEPLANAISGGIMNLFGGAFGGSGSGFNSSTTTDVGGGVMSGDSGLFTQALGGAWLRGIQMFADGGVFGAPTLFNTRNGLGMLGEKGPEAVMPLTRGPDGRLGVKASGANGGNTYVTMNINTPDADSFRRSQRQIAAGASRMFRQQ